jgi:NAD(P)H-hydrate epimerase
MAPVFYTDSGVAVPAVTGIQMREVDRVAIEEIGLSLYQMMENAGRSLAMSAIKSLGTNWREQSIVVLAGTGHNGGGGICAARHLSNHGGDVTVVLSDRTRLAEASALQLRIYDATPGRIAIGHALDELEPVLIVDAIVGYGLNGAPRGPARDMIAWSMNGPAPILSLDIPSGVDSTTGETPDIHIVAAQTLTLALPKTGLDVSLTGDLSLADIGIPRDVYIRLGITVPKTIFGAEHVVPLLAEPPAPELSV